jgi:hypothetical protein
VGTTVCAVCGDPLPSAKADRCQWCGAQEARRQPEPEQAKQAAKGKKPAGAKKPAEAKRKRKSRSVRTVSGGLPSLGKHRR